MKQQKEPGTSSMGRKNRRLVWGGVATALFMLTACTQMTSYSAPDTSGQPSSPARQTVQTRVSSGAPVLPARFRKPTYVVKDLAGADGVADKASPALKVGADITSITPMALREVLKILADQKRMTVSWASDVNQNALVDVNIGADDDFSRAIDNLLRQLDYFHEMKGNTIVVGYNETRKFHIAMPFMSSNYATAVGGNVLGGTTASNQISSQTNPFDIWTNIQTNLDRVLEIYSETEVIPSATTTSTTSSTTTPSSGSAPAPAATTPTVTQRSAAKGYYTIDKPIGLITVTAPRPLLEKIATYFENLKKELFRQISIEAKIVEVTLTDETATGIDWSTLLAGTENITVSMFGGSSASPATRGTVYPFPSSWASAAFSEVTIPGTLTGLINVLQQEGSARVLSNPRIVTLNGQPAMISVGTDLTYISSVTTTLTDAGTPATAISTDSIFSGLGLGVVPMISENDEIVISLTPVISALQGDNISYETFGVNNNRVGVPIVNIREMNTVARIKNGEILVVGGFIRETENIQEKKVRFLGDIPFIGNLFNKKTKSRPKTELVIMLQPRIIE